MEIGVSLVQYGTALREFYDVTVMTSTPDIGDVCGSAKGDKADWGSVDAGCGGFHG